MCLKTKKNTLIFTCSVFGCLVFITASCKKKSQAPPATTQDTVNVTTNQSDTLFVWVEQLRVRKDPGKDGAILAELSSGTVLIYLDEKTNFREKVDLRGKTYDEPWLKVKMPDGRTGWVFGGAVTKEKSSIPADSLGTLN